MTVGTLLHFKVILNNIKFLVQVYSEGPGGEGPSHFTLLLHLEQTPSLAQRFSSFSAVLFVVLTTSFLSTGKEVRTGCGMQTA